MTSLIIQPSRLAAHDASDPRQHIRVEAAIGKLMKVQDAGGLIGYDNAASWFKQRQTITGLRTVPKA
jgi:hypothetical protein